MSRILHSVEEMPAQSKQHTLPPKWELFGPNVC